MRRTSGILGLALVAVVAAGCSDDPGPVVTLGTVSRGEVVETIAAPATIEPRDRVAVAAPATGTVEELLVDDGDQVAAGDPLLRLSAPSVELSVAQAEAAVDAAGALAAIVPSVDLSPLLAAVRGQLEAVVPNLLGVLTQQVDTLPEDQQAAAVDAITQASIAYDDAVAALAGAEQEAAASAASASASTLAAAAAQQQQAELALEAARSRADGLLVLAPAAGVVELTRGSDAAGAAGALSGLDAAGAGDLGALLGGSATATSTGPIALGSEVSAGQTLLTIFDLTGFRAVAQVDEIDAVLLAEGQDAVVLVEAFPAAELTGAVTHVGLEPARGSSGGIAFPVTVSIAVGDLALRPGLTGSVEIVVATVDADTVVPSSALRRRGAGEVVYVVRDGRLREVAVVVEAIGDDEAAVSGDLAVGDEVVVSGLEAVEDGDPAP